MRGVQKPVLFAGGGFFITPDSGSTIKKSYFIIDSPTEFHKLSPEDPNFLNRKQPIRAKIYLICAREEELKCRCIAGTNSIF